MKKIALIVFALAGFALGMQAQQPARVPARHGVIPREQPNGDTLHTYLRGDEHWHVAMTVDGWQILEDKKGKLCYATLKTRIVDGEKKQVAVITRRTAHDAAKRSRCEQRWLDKQGIRLFKKD